MKSTFMYDEKNDILAIHNGFVSGENFKGNVDLGQLILDVSSEGMVRGIEIMDASDFLKEFGIGNAMLEHMSGATFDAVVKPNVVMLSITVQSDTRMQSAKIAVPILSKREAEILFA